MIEITKKDKEVEITVRYQEKIGGKPTIQIYGTGDFGHHLIEGTFDILDKLASTEKVGHNSEEWIKRRL
jgi:hypothetical protein